MGEATPPDGDPREALDQHLRDIISAATEGKHAVTRWVLAYEVTDGNTRIVQTAFSDATTLQDAAGLLAWARADVHRGIGQVLDALRGDN